MKGDRGNDVSYNHIFHRGNRFLWANDLRPVCLFVQGIDGQAGRNGTDGDTGRTGKPGKQVRIDFMFVLQFLTMRVVFVSSGTLWRPRRTWLPWCTRSKRTAWEKCEQNVGSSLSPVPCSPLSSPFPPHSIPSLHTHTQGENGPPGPKGSAGRAGKPGLPVSYNCLQNKTSLLITMATALFVPQGESGQKGDRGNAGAPGSRGLPGKTVSLQLFKL